MSVLMVLYCRPMLGRIFQSKPQASNATKGSAMKNTTHKTTSGLIVHRDIGTQFTSDAFDSRLADNQFVQIMSR
jgi:transposase InsO family protein